MLSSGGDPTEHRRGGTLPPIGTVLGEVLVVSADPVFEERALHVLAAAGWRVGVGTPRALIAGSLLTSDVILVDPLGQRRTLERTIDAIARIRLRPSVLLVLRRSEDLVIAVRRSIGCVDVAVRADVLHDAVLRTYTSQRTLRRG